MKLQSFFKKLSDAVSGFFAACANYFVHFKKGDIITKISYFIMGFGCFCRKQVVKGLAYLAIQLGYIYFMITSGVYYISMLSTLGTMQQGEVWDEALQIYRIQTGHNSMLLLLFGVFSIFLTILFITFYFMSVSRAYKNQLLMEQGKHINSFKDDVRDLLDSKYHITVLSIPVILTVAFTILPLIFMILMAFTNFDQTHQPPGNLFTWIGTSNFSKILYQNPRWSSTFFKLLFWTIIWAFFATFLNYILGIMLAIMINKKGIRIKSFWRTIFVTTIAIPQFVSLLLMSRMLLDNGALNNLLLNLGIIKEAIPFLTNPNVAKVTVIIVNLWVGIPYTMLITSGILMNIPEDLYEASRIDGATPVKQFFAITLPYMLHVTTPYLITQFVGNINNFNVIFLLTGGGPQSLNLYQAGETDLLVTWLYKLTTQEQNYALASTIGIVIFMLLSSISLITYNMTSAVKEEDTFS